MLCLNDFTSWPAYCRYPTVVHADEYALPGEQQNKLAARSLLVLVPSAPDNVEHHERFKAEVRTSQCNHYKTKNHHCSSARHVIWCRW